MDKPYRLTGRQIVIGIGLICAAVVLAPAGVVAASHSVVTIADGKHPSRTAAVTSKGQQEITGPVTVSGHPTVGVSSLPSVSTHPAGTPIMQSVVNQAGGYTVPSGRTLYVTSISAQDVVTPGASAQFGIVFDGSKLSGELGVPLTDTGDFSGLEYFDNASAFPLVVPGGTQITYSAEASSGDENTGSLTLVGTLS